MVNKRSILYGIQGTGQGHLVESLPIIRALRLAGHDVTILVSGLRDKVSDHWSVVSPYQLKSGLSFGYRHGRVSLLKTLQTSFVWRTLLDIYSLDMSPYDLVISDYEPISAWAARRAGVPSLGIGHQYAFNYNIPKAYKSSLMDRCIQWVAPCDFQLGTHWDHFGGLIMPPILRPEILTAPVENIIDNQVLVYLNGHLNVDEVVNFLSHYRDYHFCYYTHGRSCAKLPEHIQIKPIHLDNFMQDLFSSAYVLSTAGFSLLSESIHLGKKLLVKPVERQIEQLSNAKCLEEQALGQVMQGWDHHVMQQWLRDAKPSARRFPDVPLLFSQWLESQGAILYCRDLIESLWVKEGTRLL